MSECEEQLDHSKRENERQRKLLDAVLKPEVRLLRTVFSAVTKPDPERPELKKEEQRPELKKEEEQRQEPVPVKGEDENETAHSSQLHQSQTTASSSAQQMGKDSDEGVCYGVSDQDNNPCDEAENSESDQKGEQRSRGPESDVNKVTGSSDSRTSGSENGDSDSNWEEPVKPQPTVKTKKNISVSAADKGCNSEKKSLRCSVCGKTLELKDCRQSSKLLWCSACAQRPKQSAKVITFKGSCSEKKSFRGSVCEREFGYKVDAVRHIRIYTGEKPYRCSVCGKVFAQSQSLQSHTRTHTGEKPFSCSVCSKRFILRGGLARHMRVHTGEKPYSCADCNRCFRTSETLLKHIRTHTGEKPYCCPVCDKRFVQNGHVKQHMTLHTEEKSFMCPFLWEEIHQNVKCEKSRVFSQRAATVPEIQFGMKKKDGFIKLSQQKHD